MSKEGVPPPPPKMPPPNMPPPPKGPGGPPPLGGLGPQVPPFEALLKKLKEIDINLSEQERKAKQQEIIKDWCEGSAGLNLGSIDINEVTLPKTKAELSTMIGTEAGSISDNDLGKKIPANKEAIAKLIADKMKESIVQKIESIVNSAGTLDPKAIETNISDIQTQIKRNKASVSRLDTFYNVFNTQEAQISSKAKKLQVSPLEQKLKDIATQFASLSTPDAIKIEMEKLKKEKTEIVKQIRDTTNDAKPTFNGTRANKIKNLSEAIVEAKDRLDRHAKGLPIYVFNENNIKTEIKIKPEEVLKQISEYEKERADLNTELQKAQENLPALNNQVKDIDEKLQALDYMAAKAQSQPLQTAFDKLAADFQTADDANKAILFEQMTEIVKQLNVAQKKYDPKGPQGTKEEKEHRAFMHSLFEPAEWKQIQKKKPARVKVGGAKEVGGYNPIHLSGRPPMQDRQLDLQFLQKSELERLSAFFLPPELKAKNFKIETKQDIDILMQRVNTVLSAPPQKVNFNQIMDVATGKVTRKPESVQKILDAPLEDANQKKNFAALIFNQEGIIAQPSITDDELNVLKGRHKLLTDVNENAKIGISISSVDEKNLLHSNRTVDMKKMQEVFSNEHLTNFAKFFQTQENELLLADGQINLKALESRLNDVLQGTNFTVQDFTDIASGQLIREQGFAPRIDKTILNNDALLSGTKREGIPSTYTEFLTSQKTAIAERKAAKALEAQQQREKELEVERQKEAQIQEQAKDIINQVAQEAIADLQELLDVKIDLNNSKHLTKIVSEVSRMIKEKTGTSLQDISPELEKAVKDNIQNIGTIISGPNQDKAPPQPLAQEKVEDRPIIVEQEPIPPTSEVAIKVQQETEEKISQVLKQAEEANKRAQEIEARLQKQLELALKEKELAQKQVEELQNKLVKDQSVSVEQSRPTRVSLDDQKQPRPPSIVTPLKPEEKLPSVNEKATNNAEYENKLSSFSKSLQDINIQKMYHDYAKEKTGLKGFKAGFSAFRDKQRNNQIHELQLKIDDARFALDDLKKHHTQIGLKVKEEMLKNIFKNLDESIGKISGQMNVASTTSAMKKVLADVNASVSGMKKEAGLVVEKKEEKRLQQ